MNTTSITGNATELVRPWLYAQPTGPAQPAVIIWTVITCLTSLAGNSVVLVSSLKYNAVVLDRFSVSLIRHLSLADIGFGVYALLTLGYVVSGENVYGQIPCYVISMAGHLFVGVDTSLVCGLNISKLTVLIFPLQRRTRTSRQGNCVAAAVWVVLLSCITLSLCLFLFNPVKETIVFKAAMNKCSSQLSPGFETILQIAIGLVFVLLPTLVILFTTACLLSYLRRQRRGGELQRQGLITHLLISGIFCVAYTPAGCYNILDALLSQEEKEEDWFSAYFIFSNYIVYMNYACNPIIYLYTIQSYRHFIQMKVKDASRNIRYTAARFINIRLWRMRHPT